MILQIDDTADEIYFPDPHYGDEDGCFAIGGDLSIDRLLLAYSNGIFPWYSFRDQPEILWFCPMKRFVIFPDEIHISHSMRTLMRKNRYSVGINEDFDGVIRGCSKTNGRYWEDGAWLGENIIQAFTALHEQGFAASVEVWDNETDELWWVDFMVSPSARSLSEKACSPGFRQLLRLPSSSLPDTCRSMVAR